MTINTDKTGYATTRNNVLPVGKYVIYEITPPLGYTLDDTLSKGVSLEINNEGEMAAFTIR